MKCCGNCFGDFFLTQQITEMSSETGNCSYCNAKQTSLISPSSLFDIFDGLREALYQESINPQSEPLGRLLESDWKLFEALDDSVADSLLGTIVPDISSLRFEAVVARDSDAVLKWDELSDELQHENRFFPKKMAFSDEREGLLFEYLTAKGDTETKLYRARLLTEGTPFDLNKMGKPPLELVSYGRANPMGIPYLYVATTVDTAIAEIRPYKHATVCVATFELTEPLKFADFCNPLKTISPFQLDDQGLRILRMNMPFLLRMGEELSKPVTPHKSHLEYLPSQYLCEYLKQQGFHGVMYKSSVGTGLNYAVFDDSTVSGIEVKTYRVDDVQLEISPSVI